VNKPLASSFLKTWPLCGLLILGGCASGPIPTLTIYETPQSFVRLETDPSLSQEAGHSHPADISTERMAAVLRGIIVQEPLTRLPLYDDLSIPRQHPAFSESAIEFWAPLLRLALSKATPDELVTFYQSQPLSGMKREVTSGGVFLDGEELHVILSNLRSDTQYTADFGAAETQDDRRSPMKSIAPQPGQLVFVPESASRVATSSGLSRVFHNDRREIVVLLNALSLGRTDVTRDSLRNSTPRLEPSH
jgi:hypothetical protein